MTSIFTRNVLPTKQLEKMSGVATLGSYIEFTRSLNFRDVPDDDSSVACMPWRRRVIHIFIIDQHNILKSVKIYEYESNASTRSGQACERIIFEHFSLIIDLFHTRLDLFIKRKTESHSLVTIQEQASSVSNFC